MAKKCRPMSIRKSVHLKVRDSSCCACQVLATHGDLSERRQCGQNFKELRHC